MQGARDREFTFGRPWHGMVQGEQENGRQPSLTFEAILRETVDGHKCPATHLQLIVLQSIATHVFGSNI